MTTRRLDTVESDLISKVAPIATKGVVQIDDDRVRVVKIP
jgi:hypothetical protein